jgi:CRP/FNR family transcriptional regulator, polysaccharide utilization system transcription regulator
MSGINLIHDCKNCPQAWKNFHLLTEKELEIVNQNRYEATFKAGEIMIKQGSPTSSALFMAKGIAKTYIEGINGKNFILDIAMPGRLVTGPGVYVDARHTFSVSALSPVQACFIGFDIIKQLLRTNIPFAESMMTDISARSIRSQTQMINLIHKKMPGRIADALLYFSDEVFMSDEYEMILSRQEFGEMTNMARECVVRILRELEDSGVIYSDAAKIKILDKEKLIRISEKG